MGDLANPLYHLPSECVTVLISNFEQMRSYKDGPNLSGDRKIIEWLPADKIFFLHVSIRLP